MTGWFFVSLFLCALGGIYQGLQDRFGQNIVQGYREYKRSCNE